jgi:NAD(P)H dehydrogenase (quinone)
MAKTAVIYDSSGNNTKKMAEIVFDEFHNRDTPCELFHVKEFPLKRLPEFDGFFIGTPNYFGGMTALMKKFFDDSIKFFRALDGKAGAAFCSTGIIGGGGETVIMDVIKAFLIHGMIIQGNPAAGHFGVVSIGRPDERVEKELRDSVQRFVALLTRVARD